MSPQTAATTLAFSSVYTVYSSSLRVWQAIPLVYHSLAEKVFLVSS